MGRVGIDRFRVRHADAGIGRVGGGGRQAGCGEVRSIVRSHARLAPLARGRAQCGRQGRGEHEALQGNGSRHRRRVRAGADSRRQVYDGRQQGRIRSIPQNKDKDKDKEAVYDEGPQHQVAIEPFWMGKYEVTWDEYELWSMGLDSQRRADHEGQGDLPG